MKDKIAIVTGAAGGIGSAIARVLSENGARVIISDIHENEIRQLSEDINCDMFVADLSKASASKDLVDYVVQKYKSVDILINVAGSQTVAPIKEFPESEWNKMISVMLTAPFLLTKYCWPYMEAQRWGRIVNISSIYGLVASEYKVAYVAAKHGIIGITKTAALEGGEYGITVNAICPSYVRTSLLDRQVEDQAKYHGVSEDEVVSRIMLQKAAIKKLLNPKEVANMVSYLCSDLASSVTGATMTIDGGWTAN